MPRPSSTSSRMGPPVAVRRLQAGTSVVALLGTGSVSRPRGSSSWIEYYRAHTGTRGLTCCAEGCYESGKISGAHVKVANGPTAAALLHTRWYVVPACAAHNKRSSCATITVKQVLAVEAPPSVADRLVSWGADVRKVVRTVVLGKKR